MYCYWTEGTCNLQSNLGSKRGGLNYICDPLNKSWVINTRGLYSSSNYYCIIWLFRYNTPVFYNYIFVLMKILGRVLLKISVRATKLSYVLSCFIHNMYIKLILLEFFANKVNNTLSVNIIVLFFNFNLLTKTNYIFLRKFSHHFFLLLHSHLFSLLFNTPSIP